MDRQWSLAGLILLVNIWQTATAVTSHLRYKARQVPIGPDPASLQVPDCMCGCCHTAYRTPDELADGGSVFLKCALNEVQSHGTAITVEKTDTGKTDIDKLQCQTTCINRETYTKKATNSSNSSANADNTSEAFGLVTSSNTADTMFGMAPPGNEVHPMDYNRYCAYNCRPYDFTIGQICVNLGDDMKSLLKGEVDPAVSPKITDPAVQLSWDRASGISPPPAEATTPTTTPLPCASSDPCAYKLMDASIAQANAYYRAAESMARQNMRIAGTFR